MEKKNRSSGRSPHTCVLDTFLQNTHLFSVKKVEKSTEFYWLFLSFVILSFLYRGIGSVQKSTEYSPCDKLQ